MNDNDLSQSTAIRMKNPINRGQLFLRSMAGVIVFIIGIILSLLWDNYLILLVEIIIMIFLLLCAIFAEIINPPEYVEIRRDGVLFQRRYSLKDRFHAWDEFEVIQLYSDSERYQGLHTKGSTIWIRNSTKTIFVSYEIALVIIDECLKITGRQIRSIKMN